MGDFDELLITSSETALQVWQGCKSGSFNNVHSYKIAGIIARTSLNFISDDYIIVGDENQPIIHAWPITDSEEAKPKLVLPQVANIVLVSPDNVYLAVAFDKKLCIWQLCSGAFVTSEELHLSAITCLKFSFNSNYLIVGTMNGTVIIYKVNDLVRLDELNLLRRTKPLYTKSDHTSAVTKIETSSFDMKARFATASLDRTCRVYEILTGRVILQFRHTEEILQLIIDKPFWNVFLGGDSGIVWQFKLTNPPKTTMYDVMDIEDKLQFTGHEKQITCFALNSIDDVLASGSADQFVIVWNIDTRQILSKMEFKSSITNLIFMFNFKLKGYTPKWVTLRKLQLTPANDESVDINIFHNQDILRNYSSCPTLDNSDGCDTSDKAEAIRTKSSAQAMYDQFVSSMENSDTNTTDKSQDQPDKSN